MNELLKEIEADALASAPADKLETIRNNIRYLRDLDKRIENVEATLSSLKRERRDLTFDTLPTMFMQLQINHLGISASGNLPAYEATLEDSYHANIQANWPEEKRQAAIDWIHKHRMGDIIKTTLTIDFGLGQDLLLKSVLKALKAVQVVIGTKKIKRKTVKVTRTVKVTPTIIQQIPWNTLTAMVKERFTSGDPLSDTDLRILGASVNKIVKITQVKEK
jgi:hypothetical protein